jgi:hypothetical protein
MKRQEFFWGKENNWICEVIQQNNARKVDTNEGLHIFTLFTRQDAAMAVQSE